MPTFIDESGDVGQDPVAASRHFRLTAVWMPSPDSCHGFRQEIASLRHRLGLPTDFEFKYVRSHNHPDRRREFFRASLRYDFRFVICSIDKHRPDWKGKPREDYFAACAVTLAAYLWPSYLDTERRNAAGRLNEAITVDDNRDREFLAAIKTKFRGLTTEHTGGGALVGKVKFEKSHTDAMLQLTDMVCGAVAAHLDGTSEWYEMIGSRSLGIVELP